jgi:hypothetical protein
MALVFGASLCSHVCTYVDAHRTKRNETKRLTRRVVHHLTVQPALAVAIGCEIQPPALWQARTWPRHATCATCATCGCCPVYAAVSTVTCAGRGWVWLADDLTTGGRAYVQVHSYVPLVCCAAALLPSLQQGAARAEGHHDRLRGASHGRRPSHEQGHPLPAEAGQPEPLPGTAASPRPQTRRCRCPGAALRGALLRQPDAGTGISASTHARNRTHTRTHARTHAHMYIDVTSLVPHPS